MVDALSVIRRTVIDWWYSMIGLALVNVIWLVSLVTVVLLPLATAGLYYVTYGVSKGTGQTVDDFLEGARRYAGISYRLAFVNLLIAAIIGVNLIFYGEILDSPLAGPVLVVVILVSFLWLMSMFYVWPFLMVQEDKRLTLALKNSLLLTMATPFYSILLFVFCVIILTAGIVTVIGIAFFVISIISLLGNHAVRERLSAYDKLPSDDESEPTEASA